MIWTWALRPYYRTRLGVSDSPLAMRAGLMALGCFPFIFASATKWNIITFIIGHSHEKLQRYHQFLSYIFVILSLIHSFPWFLQGIYDLKPTFKSLTPFQWKWHVMFRDYYSSGAVLLFILVWLCWASLPLIRRYHYELFKHIHIISAFALTSFFFIHCREASGCWHYLFATMLIYATACGCRLLWILYINRAGIPRASFELLHSGAVKLRVKCYRRQQWRPGQHYFLHFLTVMPFQSHPFTIANTPSEDNELEVLIRKSDGVTRRLFQHLQSKDASATIPVILDGPFGGMHHDLSVYDRAILFAGGSGITFILPILQDLVQRAQEGTCACMSIQVVWSVRERGSILWMMEELTKVLEEAPNSMVTVQVHITGAVETLEPEPEVDKRIVSLGTPLYGRPDAAGMIHAAASEGQTIGIAGKYISLCSQFRC
ncbi:hypothetical protein VNI00_009142 [Paramarasmius palmivorus]|uniref:ferric-chelate reductase (NADPH) n=1 Tax=Paramarasmius palmivorus TaxID=297713 RepID=A0AAW0CR50_9AGAR